MTSCCDRRCSASYLQVLHHLDRITFDATICSSSSKLSPDRWLDYCFGVENKMRDIIRTSRSRFLSSNGFYQCHWAVYRTVSTACYLPIKFRISSKYASSFYRRHH
ncbi:hypothetical protein CEXT_687611 [Caerostris extrusa]|uniref:Uncharacterized protein n=1 Tax=Caerostris extrusa TaxID=172846 RepID=A0AAV4TZ03_CAEEX|nr:hypothetical protein CEXT_687611 [Caerostris extrusa]